MRQTRRLFPQLDAKISGDTTPSRMWLLSGVAVVLGCVGGGAAVLLFHLIGFITNLTLLHRIGWDMPDLRDYHPTPWIILTAVGGAFLVSLLAVWAPVIRGHGIPESLEAILMRDSKIKPRAAVAKPLSAAITIGTGGPFGAEGPIIVTGGSIGSLIGQFLTVSPSERKIMLATGAAAGMAATFNAPLAAVILAVEVLLFERSLRTIVPLSIATAIAAGIHIVAFGGKPLFEMAPDLHVSLAHLPLFALVGLVGGALAVVLSKGLFAIEAAFRKLPLNIFWWPLLGALAFSVIGLIEPRTLSMGYAWITDTLQGQLTVGSLAVLLVAKLASWWISLGSQTSGGTLAPMFLIGATSGALLGHGMNSLFPSLHASIPAFALVAMAATFGAAAKAMLTSVVFAMEVTGEYRMIVPLLIGVAVAELVAQLFLSDRLMTEKLGHRGLRVDFGTEVDALRMRVAHHIMRTPAFLPSNLSAGAAVDTHLDPEAPTMAVVDDHGAYLGMVNLAELDETAAETPLVHLLDSTAAPIDAHDHLGTALAHLTDSGIDTLAVVDDDGKVVGQLHRSDIAAERHRHMTEREALQPGWAQALRRRGNGHPRDDRPTVEHAAGSPRRHLPATPHPLPSRSAGHPPQSGRSARPPVGGRAERRSDKAKSKKAPTS
ncbi:chloride channel protein [Rhodococcus sp. D2-41]|uniref:Chloride channel protein n=1 Tax=Speluncibacter jeojiensis TaxID=2710754 RepID=A0A9X4M038_9ACTN|nr:chloride channel protein [Rhodococcus sp. D2-41]MDG3009809.1 chloride channel protein [Rhodococcus sp. D2-41]MDG3014560.1 chloride channel protein [Corynebacteriales bacterium D3-21]